MITKICKKCNQEKTIDNFRKSCDNKNNIYYRGSCKECEKKYSQNYRLKNKEKVKQINKKWRDNNKEKKKIANANYISNNRDKYNEYARKYKKYKIQKDKLYKLKIYMREIIRKAFKRKNYKENSKTEKIIGLKNEEFRKYLLQTFENNYGYKWNGIEKVNIDHIIPLSTAKNEEEITKLCHYTNLQLLKEKDNIRKRDIINWNINAKE